MKERGMIFNGEMVRAILEGRKTQTRRPVKPQPELTQKSGFSWNGVVYGAGSNDRETNRNFAHAKCPFGNPGDRIWVRETWAFLGNEDGCCVDWNDNLCKGDEKTAARIYRASCEQRAGDYGMWSIPDDADWKPHTENQKFEGAWRPSIHMPRWASRITLEITDVRVERLHSISEEDAQAEGVQPACYEITPPEAAYRASFGEVWRGIYGDKSWDVNSWCWVIEFKRIAA
ncbi:TPA: hypothetical protein N2F43_003984 [Salmonella enterica]|nr:hypothetical protein [Salmonella enterica]